jgi:dienelactone hydrolase
MDVKFDYTIMELEGFERFAFSHDAKTKDVYRRGTGPAVVLIHELPGMTEPCVDLARRLADEGFTVYLPLMFGEPLHDYGSKPLGWACIWKEFNILRSHASSPITDWLRALSRLAFDERGGRGVGAIGMCLTGGFALSLMMDATMVAPVLSQPSLPGTPWGKSDLAISRGEWENAVKRSRSEKIPVLGLKFAEDKLCPPERFAALARGFGENFRPVVVSGRGHSVLTQHYLGIEENERRRVWSALVDHLSEQLK